MATCISHDFISTRVMPLYLYFFFFLLHYVLSHLSCLLTGVKYVAYRYLLRASWCLMEPKSHREGSGSKALRFPINQEKAIPPSHPAFHRLGYATEMAARATPEENCVYFSLLSVSRAERTIFFFFYLIWCYCMCHSSWFNNYKKNKKQTSVLHLKNKIKIEPFSFNTRKNKHGQRLKETRRKK